MSRKSACAPKTPSNFTSSFYVVLGTSKPWASKLLYATSFAIRMCLQSPVCLDTKRNSVWLQNKLIRKHKLNNSGNV